MTAVQRPREHQFVPLELLRYAASIGLELPTTVRLTRGVDDLLHLSPVCAGGQTVTPPCETLTAQRLLELTPTELCGRDGCAAFSRSSGALAVMIDPFDSWFSYLTDIEIVFSASLHAADQVTDPEVWLRMCAAHESSLGSWFGPFAGDSALADHVTSTLAELRSRRLALAGACDRSLLESVVSNVAAVASSYQQQTQLGDWDGDDVELVGFSHPRQYRSVEVSFEPSDLEALADVAYLCAAVATDETSEEFFAVVPGGFAELLHACAAGMWPGSDDNTPLQGEFCVVASGTITQLMALAPACLTALGLHHSASAELATLQQCFDVAALVVETPKAASMANR